jgi:Putative DNA-binding domain
VPDPLGPEPFHRAMEAVLAGDACALDPWLRHGEAGRAGLAVYRNTVAKSRADALAALFPTVERLVGADWFREAALVFARRTPPSSPVMDDYGEGFADWLEAFPPARDLPFLAPVARIDRAWSEAHRAIDAPVLDASDVAPLAPDVIFAARAIIHPAMRMFWFEWTVPTVWLANRPGTEPHRAVIWDKAPEGLLLVRSRGAVHWHAIRRDQWLFLDACRRGLPLGRAAASVMVAEPLTDLSRLFAELLGFGVFTRLNLEPSAQ